MVAVLLEEKNSAFHNTYKKSHKTSKENLVDALQGFGPMETGEVVSEISTKLDWPVC